MGKDMDGTGKKTDRKPKTKKVKTAGSRDIKLSVVGGGKESGAAQGHEQRASVRKSSAQNVPEEKQESFANEKKPAFQAAGKKNVKKDTGKQEDIKENVKKEEIKKEETKEKAKKEGKGQGKEEPKGEAKKEIKEETKREAKGGAKEEIKEETKEETKEEIKESKKETKKRTKKGSKTESKTAAKTTAKRETKKGTKKRTPKGTKKEENPKETNEPNPSPNDTAKKSTSNTLKKKKTSKNKSEKNVLENNTSENNTPEKNSSKKNISEKKPAAQQKEQTGKKAETKKTAVKSTDKTASKAAGKTASQKKQNGSTRSRNPNLRLVKNEEFGEGKTRKQKKEPQRENYADNSWREYDDKRYGGGIGEWFFQHKSLFLIGFTIFAVVMALVGGYYYIVTNYRVTTVYVDGNIHYSNEEIMDMVMSGAYGNNSLYLAMKYKDKGVDGVPFVERMDINILTPNTIRINVYEKALAGYVEYLGRYMYFDRDGIVVESSLEKTESIPQVTGLKFGYVVLNEALPVENDAIFKRILSITQLLDKYELTADRIYFNADYDLTLYFDGVRVTLGSSEEIDEKVMRLQYILPELTGKSGTLSMENYTEDTKSIPFLQD